jgi:hypothetical protein
LREPNLDETDGTIKGMGANSLLAHSFAIFSPASNSPPASRCRHPSCRACK